MQAEELIDLVHKIQRLKCELQTVEVKAAHLGCPTRLFDTLSSFSNQDDGGIILFGLDEKRHFEVVGVYDSQDLQKKVTEQCNQMSPTVRALFTVAEIEKHIVVSAEIPAVDISDRPVFYKGVGRIKGSYVRVGDADEQMNEYEIYSYDAFRKRIRDDLRPVPEAKLSFFDEEKLEKYLMTVKKERLNVSMNLTDQEILELMGVISDGIPTLAGELCFSKYPQGAFPQLCVTAVSLPGLSMGDLGTEGERFIDNERITGCIGYMVEAAVDFVRKNGRKRTIIDESGKRIDKEEYPPKAVREVILNALVHRDYSQHTENVPVRIEMYRDRLEIISSGGLYGRITIDALGKVRPETRNAALANILEILHTTENRYSGIPTIQKEMKNAGLPAPVFNVKRGEFIVILYNNIFNPLEVSSNNNEEIIAYKEKDLSEAMVEFCSTPRSRAELIKFTGFSRYYTMSNIVQPLIDSGKIKMTIPNKPKSSKQRYVKSQ